MAVPDEAAVGDGRPVAMKKSAWTKEEDAMLREQEDEKIIASYRMFGSKWATIAGFLPGRTDNAIKNRWHSVLSKVYQQQQRAAAPIRRLPDGTLVLFPLTPGDVKAFGMDTSPVLRHPPPGVDLSGECLNLFPLVTGDLVRGNKIMRARRR
ncbi:unnamed protein product [Miscanthus lutarioriparius]|uniref:Uncharacterized protein n=1 Tax=Miscanthus lutarioriparius TaxID=422564 RepID=A0A811MST9_9POAL|nr:unnamed protein product [Miscanthus lutarioriparius]